MISYMIYYVQHDRINLIELEKYIKSYKGEKTEKKKIMCFYYKCFFFLEKISLLCIKINCIYYVYWILKFKSLI